MPSAARCAVWFTTRSVSVCSACCVRGVNGRAVGCFAPHAIGSVVGAGGTRTDSSSSIVIMSWSMWLTRKTIPCSCSRQSGQRGAQIIAWRRQLAQKLWPHGVDTGFVITSRHTPHCSAFFCSSEIRGARVGAL